MQGVRSHVGSNHEKRQFYAGDIIRVLEIQVGCDKYLPPFPVVLQPPQFPSC